jgi:hypothetical protein
VMVFSPCCPWPVEPFPISRLGRIACHVVVWRRHITCVHIATWHATYIYTL